MQQRTIGSEGTISGIGLHTGETGTLRLRPLPPESGVQFFSGGQRVKPVLEKASGAEVMQSTRCSFVTDGRRVIRTVEHLMATMAAFGIHNIAVEVEGPEIPILDGSALDFARWIRRLGIVEQKEEAAHFKIREPLFCSEGSSVIMIYPPRAADEAQALSIHYVLDYPHPFLRAQKADFFITPEVFEREIAPARTFITEEEAQGVRSRGLGLGGGPQNTVLIRRDGSHQKHLRFPDECVRHKILDILGDLSLGGFAVCGRVLGLRSGHTLNRRLLLEIKKQKETYAE